ncbi:MAG: MATE family efflux transporter [Clostridium sp.]|nr:MATE family efflux transporter [Bacteroides sp.]MCM1197379.1 MATE family efflux transporter [Clostridium sp.]
MEKYSYGNIWKVAYPILISLVMEQLIGMTDTAFLGRVGEIELGASAIASVYYMVIFMIGFGFSLGSQIIIGRRNGEGRYSDTGKIFWHGVYFLIALATALVAGSEIFSPALMSGMVSSPQILEASLNYVRWRTIGLFFAFATAMFRAFYIGTTQTKTLTFNSIVMVLSNVLFNWILIFGKFGCPALGITGAAIGSTMAELVSLIFFIVYARTRTDRKKYGLETPARFEWKELKGMLSLSVWTMIEAFLSVATWLIFFLYVEHLGERSLAVSNIVRNVSGIIWVFLMAFSSTGSTLVSNMIGEGRQDDVMHLIGKVITMAYGIIAVILICFAIFPKHVIGIFTDMQDIIDATVPAMLVMASSYLINIPGNICFNASAGTGNTRTVFVLEVVALAIYMTYCTIVITIMKADIAVCWTAEHVYATAMLILCGTYLRSGRWKGKKI